MLLKNSLLLNSQEEATTWKQIPKNKIIKHYLFDLIYNLE